MRTRVNLKNNNIEAQYASKVKMITDLISPKNLYLVAGRATAKTSDIIAERSMNIIYDMPRSYQVFVSDTYINALTNVVPALIEGWQRKGWVEGFHFVCDKRPPNHFKHPYKPPLKYKHTISIFNGTFFNLGSLDQPSGLAGSSYQHRYGDEARLLQKKKLDKLTPALRGEYATFSRSIYYRGNTFTTDMPNLLLKDDDWILQMEKEMNQEQIELALQAGLILNEIKQEMLANAQIGNFQEKARLDKAYRKWYQLWVQARKDSTFFYIISSLVNLDILSEGFFFDALSSLGPEEFKSAILSFKISVKQGEKFYTHLNEKHFFEGSNIEYYEKFGILDKIKANSLGLKFIDHNYRLEAGMDFGAMCSLVVAQNKMNTLRCLKEFHTLPPNNEVELGEQFVEYFKYHKHKEIDLYYDRSGNQNKSIKKDWASQVKRAIEFDRYGKPTGWRVNLKSEGQSTIYQEEEYAFCQVLMSGNTPGLPTILIDKYNCKCLKSSLELTKVIVKIDKTGSKTLHKDKSSESLPMESRPMFSTNYSDAFKYLVCRKEFLAKYKNQSYQGFSPIIIKG